MKRIDILWLRWQCKLLILVMVLAGFALPAYPKAEECVLLLQKTPVQGGSVTPGVGIGHIFRYNTTVTLIAVPNPGYHFVCWLGDVSDATANNTTTTLDTPKFIIAVFARDKFGFPGKEAITTMTGSGHLFPRRREAGGGGGGGGDGGEEGNGELESLIIEEEPIPEPATIALICLGGLLLVRLRKTQNRRQT